MIIRSPTFKLLRGLNLNEGPGSDIIPPIFFVRFTDSLTQPMKLVFNRSYSIFSTEWKKANVVPIHKNFLKTEITNYRPISILNVLSKCFKIIVLNHIYHTIL